MIKRVVNIFVKFLFCLFLILVFFFSYCFVSLYFLHVPYINFFGYTCFEVGSGSMSPAIKTNDVVLVKIHDDYKVDDIITFLYDDDYVTHRVVKIDGNKVITRGDANNVYDVSVSSDKVVGKVVSIWKNVGVWQRVLFSPRVLIMFIVTLILCVFSYSYDSNLYKKFRMRRISKKKIRELKRSIRDSKKRTRTVKNKTKDTKKKSVSKKTKDKKG